MNLKSYNYIEAGVLLNKACVSARSSTWKLEPAVTHTISFIRILLSQKRTNRSPQYIGVLPLINGHILSSTTVDSLFDALNV